jgi:hypothetical protein
MGACARERMRAMQPGGGMVGYAVTPLRPARTKAVSPAGVCRPILQDGDTA